MTLAESPAAWRREAQAYALWCFGLFLSMGLARGQTLAQVLAPLLRDLCRA